MSQSSSNGKPESTSPGRAILSLGSNTGEREWNVLSAAGRLASSEGIHSARLSSLYETDPVGSGYTRCFVNAVMTVVTSLDPHSLLALCMRLEREAGREACGRSGDRILDIDIVIFEGAEICCDELILPHPRFRDRKFVLVPLAELEPGIALPPDGLTAGEAVRGSGRMTGVVRISSRGRMAKSSEYT